MHKYVRAVVGVVAFCFCIPVAIVFAQTGVWLGSKHGNLQAGQLIFKSDCAACHGGNGRGTPQEIAGFERPRTFPDFAACDQTTPEDNTAWKAVITEGGPTRGFSEIMPSFKEALTSEQIDDVIAFLRSLCRNPHWPRGELNLPRALVTEKAYPEDEEVITVSQNAQGTPGGFTHIIHEQRFGMKNQIEVDVPINYQDINHTWYGGGGESYLSVQRV